MNCSFAEQDFDVCRQNIRRDVSWSLWRNTSKRAYVDEISVKHMNAREQKKIEEWIFSGGNPKNDVALILKWTHYRKKFVNQRWWACNVAKKRDLEQVEVLAH